PRPGAGQGPRPLEEPGVEAPGGAAKPPEQALGRVSGPRPGAGQGPRPLEEPGVGVPGGAAKPPEQALGRVKRPTARGGAGAPPSGGAWGWGPRRGGEAARAGVGTRQA